MDRALGSLGTEWLGKLEADPFFVWENPPRFYSTQMDRGCVLATNFGGLSGIDSWAASLKGHLSLMDALQFLSTMACLLQESGGLQDTSRGQMAWDPCCGNVP